MILFEDQHIIVANKPSGIQTHITKIDPDKTNFTDQLSQHLQKQVYPVHRLDRGTSGIILFSKNNEDASLLQEALQSMPHKKIYKAIVRGRLSDSGLIVREMEDAYSNKKQYSKSIYRRIESFSAKLEVGKHPITFFSLLELEPITGRTHQLRRHLSKISRPIIGDKEYGDSKLNSFLYKHKMVETMLLHAETLRFYHPFNNKEVVFTAPIPDYFNTFKKKCLQTLQN